MSCLYPATVLQQTTRPAVFAARLTALAPVLMILLACHLIGCTATPRRQLSAADSIPHTSAAAFESTAAEHDPDAPETETAAWKIVASVLHRDGALHDAVYTVFVPRDDLEVTVEQMVVPTAAGIGSTFNFYHCSCGKTSVVGEFVVTDYEADDVVSTLLAKQFTVASLAPFLLHEHPRLLCVHFQGEGKSADIAELLKEALSYTGKDRDAPVTNLSR